MAKYDWKIKSYSTDISFCCMTDCTVLDCSRNQNGQLFKKMIEAMDEYGRYSVAEFTDCTSYRGKKCCGVK